MDTTPKGTDLPGERLHKDQVRGELRANARCDITDLEKSACAHCRVKRPSFVAAYDGDCATCPQPIEVGQRIRELEDGSYEHARH